MTNGESALPPRPGRQGPPPPLPKGPYIAIAAGFLLATAGGLVTFLGGDPVVKWIGLVVALAGAIGEITFFALLFSGRRGWQEPS